RWDRGSRAAGRRLHHHAARPAGAPGQDPGAAPADDIHRRTVGFRRGVTTMSRWSFGVLVVLGVVAFGAPAYAQNAQITGVVKDSSGAIIPGVTVTARNVETGFTRVGVTEANGDYRLPSLPPGRYAVTSELSGFSTETRPDIVLIIEQTAIINFTLKPAALSETVTVTGESPIVDVTKSDV